MQKLATDAHDAPHALPVLPEPDAGAKPGGNSVEWTGLGYSLEAGGGRKQILADCSGQVLQGEVCAVLGPSGAGKTSLMNILAGRLAKGGRFKSQIDGAVSLGGAVLDPVQHQRRFAYVMQDDALHATSTPRESIAFSAKYRCLGKSQHELDALVQGCIDKLGLGACADSIIGNELIKGLSGGEKKRTSIAIELVSSPQVLFLDEPTSGLDAFSAHAVVMNLKRLAKETGAVVICTIHQPSSEVFHAFDKCIFLAKGKTVYNGAVADLAPHFAAQGYPCKEGHNVADHVMWQIQSVEEKAIAQLADACTERLRKQVEAIEQQRRGSTTKFEALRSAPFHAQLAGLFRREVRNAVRDKATLGARFGGTTFLSVLVAIIFFGAGKPESTTEQCQVTDGGVVCQEVHDLQSHMGVVILLSINGMFGAAMPTLLTFPSERPVFLREASAGMYSASAYFFAKGLIELPMMFAQSNLVFLITYWTVGLQAPFHMLVIAYLLEGFAATSAALAVGCLASDAKQGIEVTPLLFVPQIMFAGFFIKTAQIPKFLRWCQYLCFLKWACNIAVVAEFEDDPEARGLLEQNDQDPDDIHLYVIATLAIAFVGRSIALAALSRKAKAVYN